jgi:transcriptional regulator with XRE-family HTH domain
MIFADKLIALRKKAGWSQEELAQQLNVSRQSVSKWEGAQSVPDLDKIVQLSRIFGVSTDYLLLENGETTAQAAPTAAPSAESKWPIMRIVWLFTMILAILGKIVLRIWASTLPPTVVYNGSDRVGELTGMRNLTETYDVGWLVFLTWFLLLLGLAGTVLYKQLREFFFGGWLK